MKKRILLSMIAYLTLPIQGFCEKVLLAFWPPFWSVVERNLTPMPIIKKASLNDEAILASIKMFLKSKNIDFEDFTMEEIVIEYNPLGIAYVPQINFAVFQRKVPLEMGIDEKRVLEIKTIFLNASNITGLHNDEDEWKEFKAGTYVVSASRGEQTDYALTFEGPTQGGDTGPYFLEQGGTIEANPLALNVFKLEDPTKEGSLWIVSRYMDMGHILKLNIRPQNWEERKNIRSKYVDLLDRQNLQLISLLNPQERMVNLVHCILIKLCEIKKITSSRNIAEVGKGLCQFSIRNINRILDYIDNVPTGTQKKLEKLINEAQIDCIARDNLFEVSQRRGNVDIHAIINLLIQVPGSFVQQAFHLARSVLTALPLDKNPIPLIEELFKRNFFKESFDQVKLESILSTPGLSNEKLIEQLEHICVSSCIQEALDAADREESCDHFQKTVGDLEKLKSIVYSISDLEEPIKTWIYEELLGSPEKNLETIITQAKEIKSDPKFRDQFVKSLLASRWNKITEIVNAYVKDSKQAGLLIKRFYKGFFMLDEIEDILRRHNDEDISSYLDYLIPITKEVYPLEGDWSDKYCLSILLADHFIESDVLREIINKTDGNIQKLWTWADLLDKNSASQTSALKGFFSDERSIIQKTVEALKGDPNLKAKLLKMMASSNIDFDTFQEIVFEANEDLETIAMLLGID